jgi:NADH-quinone oxidoreductase subunit M
MRKMGGLWARFPYLPPITLFFAAASLGLPGLGNFVGEFLILVGTWGIDPVLTVVASGGLILAAVYSLMMLQRTMHGPPEEGAPTLPDLNKRELAMMLSLMLILIWLGFYPQPFLDTSAATMEAVHAAYRGVTPAAGEAGVQ